MGTGPARDVGKLPDLRSAAMTNADAYAALYDSVEAQRTRLAGSEREDRWRGEAARIERVEPRRELSDNLEIVG